MQRGLTMIFLLAAALLSGCASTIRSEVTTFHEWPAQMANKSYVFERSKEQDASLEYRSYENLVRAELKRLGFTEAGVQTVPMLTVRIDYQTAERDVRVTEPVVINPGWGAPYPYYGRGWPGRHFPFYDPFWYNPPVVAYRDASFRVYGRQLHVLIARMRDAKKLYDVTVKNDSRNPTTANVMPYLVRSAFADFPGPSGVARTVTLERQE
ncbi:MAG: DUF4136 domain-containing protein [Proteobacteria bacterium]|nr:DUF4136 domain-containing protein [Pseudomonadota bacterium]